MEQKGQGFDGTTPDWNLIDQMGTEWVTLLSGLEGSGYERKLTGVDLEMM